jgi:hypothetical protein
MTSHSRIIVSQDVMEKAARQKRIKERYEKWLCRPRTNGILQMQNHLHTEQAKEAARQAWKKQRADIPVSNNDFTSNVIVTEMRFHIQAQILTDLARTTAQYLDTEPEGLDLQIKDAEKQLAEIHEQLYR